MSKLTDTGDRFWTGGFLRLSKGLADRDREIAKLETQLARCSDDETRAELEGRLRTVRDEYAPDPKDADRLLF